MQDTIIADPIPTKPAPAAPPAATACDDCQGTGGWFRYEPALERAAGRLYLSCLPCRGTGTTRVASGRG